MPAFCRDDQFTYFHYCKSSLSSWWQVLTVPSELQNISAACQFNMSGWLSDQLLSVNITIKYSTINSSSNDKWTDFMVNPQG